MKLSLLSFDKLLCSLCRSPLSIISNSKSLSEIDSISSLYDKNSEVIFFLRNLVRLNDEDVCELFRIRCPQEEPWEWLSFCSSCRQMVESAKNIFIEIQTLERELGLKRDFVENALNQWRVKEELQCDRDNCTDNDYNYNIEWEIVPEVEEEEQQNKSQSQSGVVDHVVVKEEAFESDFDEISPISSGDNHHSSFFSLAEEYVVNQHKPPERQTPSSRRLSTGTKTRTRRVQNVTSVVSKKKSKSQVDNTDGEYDFDIHNDDGNESSSSTTSENSLIEASLEKKNTGGKKAVPVHKCLFPNCLKAFSSLKKLQAHSRSHKTGFSCTVDGCSRVIATLRRMEIHLKSKHHPKSISTCTGCGQIFIYNLSYTFNAHLKHTVEQNPDVEKCKHLAKPCSHFECRSQFPTVEAQKIHEDVMHGPGVIAATPYKCSHCPLSFPSKVNLDRHEVSHSEDRPFLCTLDGCTSTARFKTKECLMWHNRNCHHDKEYACNFEGCGKVFTTVTNRNRHEKLHGDKKPYLCSICGKTFKVLDYINIHMRSHDPTKKGKSKNSKPVNSSKIVDETIIDKQS